MTPSFYLQFALHGLCEWAVAFGIACWIAQAWSQTPVPVLVSLVRSPLRPWPMVAFGLAPQLLALLLRPLLVKLYASGGAAGAQIPISYFLSIIYGVIVGLATSCSTAPANEQQEFRPGPPAIVSAIWIFVSFSLGALLRFRYSIYVPVEIVLAMGILFGARAMIVGEAPQPPQLPPTEPTAPPVQRALWPALVVGFLPAALILAGIAIGSSITLDPEVIKALLILGCVVSIVCCFTASILLFKRHTGGAIAGGVLLLLLNGFIAFFFGCCVALSQSGFRE